MRSAPKRELKFSCAFVYYILKKSVEMKSSWTECLSSCKVFMR